MFKFFHSSNSSSSSSVNSGGGGAADSSSNMGSLRELQQALLQKESDLKMKDSRISVLEQELKKKDDIIKNLNRELDKCRSVLQPTTPTAGSGSTSSGSEKSSPAAATAAAATPVAAVSAAVKIPTRQRLQGISAEPQSMAKQQNMANNPLPRHSKSGK